MLRGSGSNVPPLPPLSVDTYDEGAQFGRQQPPSSAASSELSPREYDDGNTRGSPSSSSRSSSTSGNGPSNRTGALYLALNFVAAISCILVNRKLLKPPINFKFPVAITLVGYIASVAGVALCRQLGFIPSSSSQDNRHGGGSGSSGEGSPAKRGVPAESWRAWAFRQPWFLIVTTAGAPLLANYSLLLNSVGVYQLSKVLVTPSILFFERLRGAKPLSIQRVLCLAIVSLGVIIVTVGDVELNLAGSAVATVNVLVAGYYKVNWCEICTREKISSLGLMSRIMPQATCLLAVLTFVLEGSRLRAYPFEPSTLSLLLACGVTAFFTSWTGYVVIANLSALTHQLLGQAKTCLILLAGALFFGSPLTQQQGGGATLAMFAMAAYTKLSVDAAASEKGLGNGRGGKSNGSYSHSEDGWQRNSHYGSSGYSGHQRTSNAGRRRSPTGRARQRRTTSAPHEDELAFII